MTTALMTIADTVTPRLYNATAECARCHRDVTKSTLVRGLCWACRFLKASTKKGG